MMYRYMETTYYCIPGRSHHLGKDHGRQKGARKKDQHEQEGKKLDGKGGKGLAGV